MVRGTCWKARGRWFDSRRRHTLSFLIFRLYPVDNSSTKTIQMKSSMVFIQSNGWTEIDLILKQIWWRFIRRQVSFKWKISETRLEKHIVRYGFVTYLHYSVYRALHLTYANGSPYKCKPVYLLVSCLRRNFIFTIKNLIRRAFDNNAY